MDLRQFAIYVLTALFSLGASAWAQDTAACKSLKAQLANAAQSGGTSAKFRRYATAARNQSDQIKQVRSDLERFGCSSGSFIVLGGRNGAACKKLAGAEVKMQANLRALERKRDSFGKQNTAALRRSIQAQLNSNDCYAKPKTKIITAAVEPAEEIAPKKRVNVTLLDKSGGNTVKLDRGSRQSLRILVERKSASGGNWRTLCVRSCDGYYFPISSTANSSDFGRDQRACQMMCPGTKTELYYHSTYGEESEDMVSVNTGRAYVDLPAAFSYRNNAASSSKACSCNISAFYKEMQRREAMVNGVLDEVEPVTTWARPSTRPDPGEDPETIANSHAKFSPEAIAALASASQNARNFDTEHKQVRVVGPVFLPASAERLDFTSNTEKLTDLFK